MASPLGVILFSTVQGMLHCILLVSSFSFIVETPRLKTTQPTAPTGTRASRVLSDPVLYARFFSFGCFSLCYWTDTWVFGLHESNRSSYASQARSLIFVRRGRIGFSTVATGSYLFVLLPVQYSWFPSVLPRRTSMHMDSKPLFVSPTVSLKKQWLESSPNC